MTILFIENRQKTYFYEEIAKKLEKEGYEIHWIVQNKQFKPSSKNNHIIKYPKKQTQITNQEKYVEEVINSDRQLNFFEKKETDYFYYYNQKIENLLQKIAPDIVFGEATAFHELLTIFNCKKLNILYLNPSTSRYPRGRFSFYKYNTLEPYKGSEETLSYEEAMSVISQITHRQMVPDYMRLRPASLPKKIGDKVHKTYAYLRGERFNTPSPLVKYKLQKNQKRNIVDWNKSAVDTIDENSFSVLYPLQMQPEANIDVWGAKYRNQQKLIDEISTLLPEDAILYVKPNPKSKYELSKELVDLVRQKKNIRILHHAEKMDNVLPKMDLVITVTGTIAIECVLINKPVITLVNTINNKAKNCTYVDSLETELGGVIKKIKDDDFIKLKEKEKVDFINILNASSYSGKISDPFEDESCVSEHNVSLLFNAFKSILEKS
jgi:hypothetical protein